MTATTIIIGLVLWGSLIAYFAWNVLFGAPKRERVEAEYRRGEIRDEIARWREASTRTYERQGIRRNR